MKKQRKLEFLFLITVFVLLLADAGTPHAAQQTSTNYLIEAAVITAGGGETISQPGSLPDLRISHTTGQATPIGVSDGVTYKNETGFWHLFFVHGNQHVISLARGFNIISYTGGIKAFDFIKMLGSPQEIESVSQFDTATGNLKTAGYDPSGNPSGDDFVMTNGEGYLVYTKSNKSLNIPLIQNCSEIDLHAGMNLAGFSCIPNGTTSYQMLNKLGGGTLVYSIQRFNPATGRFESASYMNGQPAGIDFLLTSWEGYIIYLKQDIPGFRP